jgi:2-keto-4-pentenoate hydratase/2-oxohepta-3-ene-1,7-dioic acid hydratase in catechol pathway
MQLATFVTEGSSSRLGVVLGDMVADLSATHGAPTSILELFQRGDYADALAPLLAKSPRLGIDEVVLRTPVPNPAKYMAIGLNTAGHRKDINMRWLMREPKLIRIAIGYLLAHPRPKHPFFFAKATSSIIGPGDPIVLPLHAERVDWEGELALVIGAPTHEASLETARRSIAGYLIANDVSVRDWQTDNPTSAALAKSYPTHGPLGPWIVTADQFDPSGAELRTYLNGNLRQRGRIADLTLSPTEIVSCLSNFCVLEPGDVIACGTFAGTGWPAGRFLRPADTVRIEVDGIGELVNPVSAHRTVKLARH